MYANYRQVLEVHMNEERVNLLTCLFYYLAAYYYGFTDCGIYKAYIHSERATLMYIVATAYLLMVTTFNRRIVAADDDD